MTIAEYASYGLVICMVDGEKSYYSPDDITRFEINDKLLRVYKEDERQEICVACYNVGFVKYIRREPQKEE